MLAIAINGDKYPEYEEITEVKDNIYILGGKRYIHMEGSPFVVVQTYQIVGKSFKRQMHGASFQAVYSSTLDSARNALVDGKETATFYREDFQFPTDKELIFNKLYMAAYVPTSPNTFYVSFPLSTNQENVSFNQILQKTEKLIDTPKNVYSAFGLGLIEYPYLALFLSVYTFEGEFYVKECYHTEDVYYKIADEYQEAFKNAIEWHESN